MSNEENAFECETKLENGEKTTPKKKVFVFLMLGLAVLVIATVGIYVFARFWKRPIKAEELTEGILREEKTTLSPDEAFQSAYQNFAWEFFRNSNQSESTVISPASMAFLLGMLQEGAGGATKEEILSTLGLNDSEKVNQYLLGFRNTMKEANKEIKFRVGNSIWIEEAFKAKVRDEFLQQMVDYYSAETYCGKMNQQMLKDINNWAYNSTQGSIPKVFEKLNPDTVMVLLNAVSFDAEWDDKYEKGQVFEKELFYDEEHFTSTAEVTLLKSTEQMYLENDFLTGFVRPYKGEKYAFVGLLPKEGVKLKEAMERLDGEGFIDLYQNRDDSFVEAWLPEFSYGTLVEAKKVLQEMGISQAFDYACADFSNMVENADLYVTDVGQIVTIEVDRVGTKGKAISFAASQETSGEVQNKVRLDRPFIYAIVEMDTGLPVFIGDVKGDCFQ